MEKRICVVGLGYVGLPLAVEFDAAGHAVVGYDTDEARIRRYVDGTDVTGAVGNDRLAESEVTFTADPEAIADADYVIVAVPTPIRDEQAPDVKYVESAGEVVGRNLSPGTTVVLESTVFPGATEEVFRPAIERTSGYAVGEDFSLGYSPERLSLGDDVGVRDVTKVVSGRTAETCDAVASLYETVVESGVYRAPSIETAETAKLIENVQRDLNIALVNELAMLCAHLDFDLDTREVLNAAETKWNFHGGYRPGLVGGNCIPVDPFFLVYRSEQCGYAPELIRQARETNERMTEHVASLTVKALRDAGKRPDESRVLILGLTYKANVESVEDSKIGGVVEALRARGVEPVGYDPLVDPERVRDVLGVQTQRVRSFRGFDGVLLATPHDEFETLELSEMRTEMRADPALVDLAGSFDRGEATRRSFEYVSL